MSEIAEPAADDEPVQTLVAVGQAVTGFAK